MKLITWNVNGIRAVERKGELEKILAEQLPDVLLLQETKAHEAQLTAIDAEYPDYKKVYVSAEKAGYSGVSAWIKKNSVELLAVSIPKFGVFDDEGRTIEIKIQFQKKLYTIIGCYFPNGGKSDDAWEGKLIFYKKFLDSINQKKIAGENVFWGGDVNTAHQAIDLARPKDNEGKIGFHPLERAWIDQCVASGWVDVWRQKNPETKDVYSWWHVITRSRAKNVGWRIDYWFCDQSQLESIKKIQYLTDQMGSDHCPVLLEL